jgi:hypothetical protein
MSKIGTLQAALDQKRQELTRLELELCAAQRQRLPEIHCEYGFQTIDELIKALAEFASPSLRTAIQKCLSTGKGSPQNTTSKIRKKRAVITDEMKDKIRVALARQSEVAADIAKHFNVSVSAVNQLKRKLGLTKPVHKGRHFDG